MLAGCEIRRFQILRAKRRPRMRTIDVLLRNIVHRNRDPKHTCQGNQGSPHMPIDGYTMVGAPIRHYAVYIPERTFSRQPGSKPSGRPGTVGTLINDIMRFFIQDNGLTLGDLQNRADPLNNIDPEQGNRHFCAGFEVA